MAPEILPNIQQPNEMSLAPETLSLTVVNPPNTTESSSTFDNLSDFVEVGSPPDISNLVEMEENNLLGSVCQQIYTIISDKIFRYPPKSRGNLFT